MTDYPYYKNYVSFLEVLNFPSSCWSITSDWEWEKYVAQVKKDDLKEKIEKPYLFSLYLDEVTAIDNNSWVCMSIYMVNGHIRHSYLLGIQKMKKNSIAGNIYELFIKTLKEIGGMCWRRWSINHTRTKDWNLCQTTTISFTIYDWYSLYGS